MNEMVGETPPQTAVLTVTDSETLLKEKGDSGSANNAVTGHCWELEEGHGSGVEYSAAMGVGLDSDSEE